MMQQKPQEKQQMKTLKQIVKESDFAINELFIKQTQSLIYIIPSFIVLAFALKGISLY